MEIKTSNKRGNIGIAIAIIIAGLLIATSVVVTNNKDSQQEKTSQEISSEESINEPIVISEVSEEDYIRGDINAPIKIIEYSDTECPFCKRLHQTLKKVHEEYPEDVVWVYRHLPMLQLHPKALPEAVATECAGEQRGDDAFWQMLDRIYEETPGNNRLDLEKLPEFATDIGLDVDKFNECLTSNRYEEKIAKQTEEAFNAGAKGTPFSVVVTPEGNYISVPGAQPIDVWTNLIDSILENES